MFHMTRWDYNYTGGDMTGGLNNIGDKHIEIIGTKPEHAATHGLNKMNQIRARTNSFVKDPATAEKWKPWYNQFCKQLCFHNDYLLAYNRPNIMLVDINGKGVERITEKGIVTNGQGYKLDYIIYATGFEYAVFYSNRSTMTVHVRNGVTLNDKWAKNSASALHDFHSRGFPNLFTVSLLQSGLTPNLTHMLTEQVEHIAWIVAQCHQRKINIMEVTEEAEQKWTQTIVELGMLHAGFIKECTPGYYNNEGKASELVLRNSTYGLGSSALMKLLDEWRKAGTVEGLECK